MISFTNFSVNAQSTKIVEQLIMEAMESKITEIESCIQSWCNKHGVTRSSFFCRETSYDICNS